MQKLDLKQKMIVVFYMLYFGDMVSITPFLEVLRREAEGSRIILVIDQRFAESVQYNPNIDEIVPVDRRAGGLSASWKLGRQLRDRHPDILFVLHGTTRTFLMGLAMHPNGGPAKREHGWTIFHGSGAAGRAKRLPCGRKVSACSARYRSGGSVSSWYADLYRTCMGNSSRGIFS